jgi:hypothetical protein
MKPRQKETNERTSEYDISAAFPFFAVTICKSQQKGANQWACSGVRVTIALPCIYFDVTSFAFYKNSVKTRLMLALHYRRVNDK